MGGCRLKSCCFGFTQADLVINLQVVPSWFLCFRDSQSALLDNSTSPCFLRCYDNKDFYFKIIDHYCLKCGRTRLKVGRFNSENKLLENFCLISLFYNVMHLPQNMIGTWDPRTNTNLFLLKVVRKYMV